VAGGLDNVNFGLAEDMARRARRRAVLRPWLIGLVALTLTACEREKDGRKPVACSDVLKLIIAVRVSSPHGLPVSSVSATNRDSGAPGWLCDVFPEFPSAYLCAEQGRGHYVIQVTSGKRSWTKTVDLPGDECHATSGADLELVLDPATAD